MKQSKNNIRVFVRVRPFKDIQNKQDKCVTIESNNTIIMADKQSNTNLSFTFDKVFGPQVQQEEFFKDVALDIINCGLQGINGTIFAYGQTSSGKTHTCIGPNYTDPKLRGLLPRIISQVIKHAQKQPQTVEFRIKLSMIQIYNQKIKDLLDISKDNLKIRSTKSKGIYIENVTEKYLINQQQAFICLKKGIENRSVGCTNMNAQSSRSHMAFLISIYQNDFKVGQAKTAKITLIDLAGSQKISKTGAQGKLLEQAKQINKSLSALGKVINILSDAKNTHIPYRDSKLTRLLQESLGGNSFTNLIVNISPSSNNDSQTIGSLRFGYRAKAIQNKPKINKQYTIQQLLKLLEKAQLKIRNQDSIIQSYQKKKRAGGYGCHPNQITMHMIPDIQESQQSSNGQIRSNQTMSDYYSSIKLISSRNNISTGNRQSKADTSYMEESEEIISRKGIMNLSRKNNQSQQNIKVQQKKSILQQNNKNKKNREIKVSWINTIKENTEVQTPRLGFQKQRQNYNQQQNQENVKNQRNKQIRKNNQERKSKIDCQINFQQKNAANEKIYKNQQKSSSKEIKQDQEKLENIKLKKLENMLKQTQTNLGQMLLKYHKIKSQNQIHKSIINRKNTIIQQLKQKLRS